VGLGVSDAELITKNSEAFVAILKGMQDGVKKTTLLLAYVRGFRAIMYRLLALAALCFLDSLLVEHHTMDRNA
jgi:hypothetical protein